MRFYYVALAVVAILLCSINAVAADAEVTQITRTSEIVGITQVRGAVKRFLRTTEEEEDSLDSHGEERGVSANELIRIAQSKKGILPVAMDQLTESLQTKILSIMRGQKISQKRFAKKLGLTDVDDGVNRNTAFFARWRADFREGKKPKKVPEDFIGGR
ncbi:Secreted RxLR effector peptide protein [Phytophthora palmivora]|uniref:RxLR effector protein n=1 Tax=Phytophthora palmivora TaxID=4796 RepID=A0A2P4Y6X1_9STRA|nr:Secreted RxLR effector peptide protein [Phytophthora palmivora]